MFAENNTFSGKFLSFTQLYHLKHRIHGTVLKYPEELLTSKILHLNQNGGDVSVLKTWIAKRDISKK